MSNQSPGGMMKMKCTSALLFLISVSTFVDPRPHNPVIVSQNPYSWISTFPHNYFIPQASHATHPVGYSHLLGSQNYLPRIFYYPGGNNFPLPVPQYIPVFSPTLSPAPFINQPISVPLLRQQQSTVLIPDQSNFTPSPPSAAQQNEELVPIPEKTNVTPSPPSTTQQNEEPIKIQGKVNVTPSPTSTTQQYEEPVDQQEATEPPKTVSTRPPPTAEEEEHLTKFEEEYELLKITKDSKIKKSFQQFTPDLPAFLKTESNVKPETNAPEKSYNDGFDESKRDYSDAFFTGSKLDIRLPNYVTRKNKPKRSATSGPNKRMFAVITAVINHKRRQRQLQQNDLYPIQENVEDDLPPLLIGEPATPRSSDVSEKLVKEGNVPLVQVKENLKSLDDDAEMMEFSDEEKREPVNRFLTAGTGKALALMNFAGQLYNPVGLEFSPSVKESISFDYEVSNDSFSEDVARDLPPTLFFQKQGKITPDSIVSHSPSIPHEEQLNTSPKLNDSVEPSENVYGVRNSDLPPLPSADIFDENPDGIIDLTELTTTTELPNNDQNSDSASLPDINTSDLPPLPGNLFEDELKAFLKETEDSNSTPNTIQVDDLISGDLPPFPDLKLFPIGNQNDLPSNQNQLPTIPLPEIPEQFQETQLEIRPTIPISSQNDLPPIPQIPEAQTPVKPTLVEPEIVSRPVFPGGNLPPVFPEPEEEPLPIIPSPVPTTPTPISLPQRSRTTEKTAEYEIPRTHKEFSSQPETIKPKKTISASPENEEVEELPSLPPQNNDWIRDIALKALDRGISVQHIYSINVGKINMKSEGKAIPIEHAGFVQTFIRTFEHSLSQAVDAVSKSVLSAINPSRAIQSATSSKASNTPKSKDQKPASSNPVPLMHSSQTATTDIPKNERRPLPIDPRHIPFEDYAEENIRKSQLVPLDIDFRVLNRK